MDAFLSVYEALKPTARRLASVYNLDADDLLQDLALEMLEKPRNLENPEAYYTVVLRHLALHRKSGTVSLDVPLSDDTDETFADQLPATSQLPEDSHALSEARAEVLYTALRHLPIEEQRYLCEIFGINAYTPVPRSIEGQKMGYTLKNGKERSRHSIRQHAYKQLRNDQEFKSAMKEVYA